MSGVGFFELVILFMIGLVVLGPKRLPKVASQIGSWLGQARRMARVMKRQLEEELDIGDDLKDLKNIGDELRDDLTIKPGAMHVPRHRPSLRRRKQIFRAIWTRRPPKRMPRFPPRLLNPRKPSQQSATER